MIVVAGTVVLALTVTGAHTVSTLDLAPGLFLIGLGAGSSIGQLFDFILAGVGMDEVGSASGVLEAVQQLSSVLGVAVLGTIFFSAFVGHSPTHALAVTVWASCRWRPPSCSSSGCRCTPVNHNPDGVEKEGPGEGSG